MMDPASDSIEPCDHRAHEGRVDLADQEQLRLNTKLGIDHQSRCVPGRISREHALPQFFEVLAIRIAVGTNHKSLQRIAHVPLSCALRSSRSGPAAAVSSKASAS